MKLHAPTTPQGQFLFFATTQFVSYFLIVANTRAYTQGSYIWTAITDGAFASQSWAIGLIIARFAVADNQRGKWAGIGYVIGGIAGSLASIYATKALYGR